MHLYRNDSLIQVENHTVPSNRVDEAVEIIREKWAWLRERGYAGDYPVEILRNRGPENVNLIEVFRWRSRQAQVNAKADKDYQARSSALAKCAIDQNRGCYTQTVRGFNKNFPLDGGMELLKGVCSCLLTIDGMVNNYPMSVKNGVVLMHRSPRMDQDGDGLMEMYLDIVAHGGEIIQGAIGPIRVEQNFNLPNDGIVKSNGIGESDFPATAVWRVAWRIRTPMGPVITDPETPLVFGPATVTHYPPVGTRFRSTTGPVALLMEEDGRRIGTLIPGELTAFDIVVTKDDEIFADYLNKAPTDIFNYLVRPEQATPVLVDDGDPSDPYGGEEAAVVLSTTA